MTLETDRYKHMWYNKKKGRIFKNNNKVNYQLVFFYFISI